MSEAERLDYLAGQVHALLGFASATIKSHPSPHFLRNAFLETEQRALAATESRLVSESFLAGQRETNESLALLLSTVI